MKFALFSFAFTMIFAAGFAQDSVRIQQRELDSLSGRIQSYSGKDSVRVKILNEYAQRCFYNLDFLDGPKAANEALHGFELEDVHLAQALNCLNAYRLEVGLLIYFESKSLTFERLGH